MHIVFDADASVDWGSVFEQQANQSGAGDLNGFHGFRYQRGSSGLGGIFSKLFSMILPVVKRAGRSLGNEALLASGRIVDDLAAGRDIGETLKTRGNESYQSLVRRASQKLQSGGKRGRSAAKPRKTVRKTIRRRSVKKATSKQKKRINTGKKNATKKRRTTADIFSQWRPS